MNRLVLSFALILSVLPVLARAQSVTDGVLINAQNMDRDMEKGIVRLKGKVQVVFQGQHLSCDKAEMNLKNQTLKAEGHVILSNERVHVEGDQVNFNYKQNTGYIYHGFVQSGQVVFEGDVIEKTGESHYLATNADYTACDTCPAGWSFSGRNIDAEIGGYARIKRPVFKIGGWPVLILPSLIVPLKSSRQSGFLVPTMDYSGNGGFAFGEDYFWAINRSQDVTLTAKRYALRGNKLRADYRYVLAEKSQGHLNTAWIADRAFQKDPANRLNRSFDRWFIDYSHHFDLPEDYTQRAEIHAVSDLRYPRDFPDELLGHGDPALENKTSISKVADNYYASAEVDLYTNLLKSYSLSENNDAVHRAPEIKYSVKEQQLFDQGPYFSMNTDYVNFARDKYNYDDLPLEKPGPNGEISRDGTFNAQKDLNRTGQRLDLQPKLSYPFQIAKKFDILPSISYRETQYRFYLQDPSFDQTAARRYVQEDVRAKTEFTRVFTLGSNPADPLATRWKHSIEPEIGYSHIPWLRRPNHPFFGEFRGIQDSRQYEPISDDDITNPNSKLQFDYEDRTIERRVFDFSLTNRFTRKVWANGNPDYQTAALFRIWQAYDFTEVRHPWSSLNALVDMRFANFETNSSAEYNGYAKVFNTDSRVKIISPSQNYLQVSYTKNSVIRSDYQIAAGETRNMGFGAGFRSTYIEASGEIDYALTTSKVQAWQYELDIRPPGHCWLLKVQHRQILGGDRQIHFAASFDFGGENKNGQF